MNETKKMTKIASRYHVGLQAKPEMHKNRKTAIEKKKKLIKTRVKNKDKEDLIKLVAKALKGTKMENSQDHQK